MYWNLEKYTTGSELEMRSVLKMYLQRYVPQIHLCCGMCNNSCFHVYLNQAQKLIQCITIISMGGHLVLILFLYMF